MVASSKHRKQRICKVEQEKGTINGEAELKQYITKYYKGLFGKPEQNNFVMDELIRDDTPQVREIENEILTEPFDEKKVRHTIFQMKHNKALGLDGIPAEFYKVF